MNKEILKLGKESLRIVKSNEKTNSFLGGFPLVASNIQWPEKNSKPLSFIGQLDLAEVNQNGTIDWLPSSGRVLFFYDMNEWPWGFDPKDKGGWSVLFDNGTAELSEQKAPENLDSEFIYEEVKYVKSAPFKSYPNAQRINLEEYGISEDDGEDDAYYEFIEDIYGEEPQHQIGGFPNPIQNDAMEQECHLASNGVYCGNSEGYSTDKAKELMKQKTDWKLLFQFDSDDDLDLMWGDSGMLYFWVKESEAKASDFSNSWMVLQCC